MSHKIIHSFNFTAVEDTIVDLRGVYANRFSVLLSGTFGGTVVTMQGSLALAGPYEAVRVSNPASGGSHNAWASTLIGMFNINLCVPFLRFSTTGGAGIDIDLDLFTVPRPVK